MTIPSFLGWRVLSNDEVICHGDVFVSLPGGTPGLGNPVQAAVGRRFQYYLDYSKEYPYRVYRRCDRPPIPRRIAMHNSFSRPLPLP